MVPTMHGHRQTKLFARYVLQGPVATNSSPALRTSALLLRTSFFVPGQSPYILTRSITTLKFLFVSVSMKIAETFPNVSPYLLAVSIINFSSDSGLGSGLLSFHSVYTFGSSVALSN